MNEFDPNSDDPRVRVINLDNNKIYMKRTDPFGFIEVNFDKGQMPEALADGKFTTWDAAERAVYQYLREKDRLAEAQKNNKKVA